MSNAIRRATIVFVSAIAVACGSNPGSVDSTPGQTRSEISVSAAGSVPAGLPSHMEVGLFENEGATWMKGSGVPWDVRYAYFTYGWADNWGYGAHDGSWGLGFLKESSGSGYLPAVQYYCMNGEAGGGEAQFLTKAQNATTMAEYFGDFKLLMQQVKTFGKPTLVLMEADGFGFLEQQTGGNSSAYAAVAASGLPELAGLPNTVAGWGQAFLQLRKSVGATNAIMGIHVSAWASGEDIAYGSVTDALQPQVDTTYQFLAPFGLADNPTGATYDVLVGDPNDRDSDYYALVEGQNRWWDASDTASVDSESFNRYASWLSLWNAKAGKRWVLWQIPIGNSNALDVCNNGQPRQGYKDNRPEYFFGAESAQHLASWAQDGVIALLFGAGAGCQSSYENDTYTDGQLFLKSRVGSFYSAGGLPLAGSGSGGGGSTGGTDAGTTTQPAFRATASSSPSAVGAGHVSQIVATIQDTGAALSGAVVDIEVYDASSNKVGQDSFTGQSFSVNQTKTYSYAWTAPSTPGTYTVRLGVFGANWAPMYTWNNAAATLTVSAGDPAQFGFEGGVQGWAAGSGVSSVASSTTEAFAGADSLAIAVSESGAGTAEVSVASPGAPAGATVTFHVFVPSGSAISSVQPFVLQGAAGNWTWTGAWTAASSLTANAWNTLTITIPSNAVTPLYQAGLQISTSGAWSGVVYLDSVSW
jgi:hypothetical protein